MSNLPPLTARKRRPEPFEFSDTLLGSVHGRRASDIEERYARALDKLVKAKAIDHYEFSVLVSTPFQLPWQENEIDFFVWQGGVLYPVEVDGAFTHKTAEQHAQDRMRDAVLNDILRRRYPLGRVIERIPGRYLEDQESADTFAREQF